MRILLLLLVGWTIWIAALLPAEVSAQSHTFTIGSLSLNVGDQGSVNVEMINISEAVTAWDIKITYEPPIASLVQCVSVGESVCDPDVRENALRILGVSEPGLTEDSILATITFECESEGSSPLSLVSQLLTVGLPPRPETRDGEINCRGEPEPSSTVEVQPTATVEFFLPSTGSADRSGRPLRDWLIYALIGVGGASVAAFGATRVRPCRS